MFSDGMGRFFAKKLSKRFSFHNKDGPSSSTMDTRLEGVDETTGLVKAQVVRV